MRNRSLQLLLVLAALAGCGPVATAAPIGAGSGVARQIRMSTGEDLARVLLNAGDLPPGWTALMSATGNAASQVTGCGATASAGDRQAAVAFSRAMLGPYLAETLAVTPSAREMVERLRQVIAGCASVTVSPLDVPRMGDDSTAFTLTVGIPGLTMRDCGGSPCGTGQGGFEMALHGQVVAVSHGETLMTVTVVGMSTLDTATTVTIARTALAKLG